MDTITHGIAGALIGKAVFRGEDMFASHAVNSGRILTWSLMLGAIFPDSDVLRDFFSSDKLLIVTWHRSITHSLLLLPLWALLLAGITRWFAKGKEWRGPVAVAISKILDLGLHADCDTPRSAIVGLGLCTSPEGTAPRRWDVAGVPPGAVSHRKNW